MAVRRVRRIIRRVDPWTVLKVSIVFNAIAASAFILGFWVLWTLMLQRGIPEDIVDLFATVRIDFTFDGELYFRIVMFLAVIGAVAATAFLTLGAVLYNLIADLVGGVEVTVLEETYAVAPNPADGAVRQRPAVRGRLLPGGIPATTDRTRDAGSEPRQSDPSRV